MQGRSLLLLNSYQKTASSPESVLGSDNVQIVKRNVAILDPENNPTRPAALAPCNYRAPIRGQGLVTNFIFCTIGYNYWTFSVFMTYFTTNHCSRGTRVKI